MGVLGENGGVLEVKGQWKRTESSTSGSSGSRLRRLELFPKIASRSRRARDWDFKVRELLPNMPHFV